MRTPSGQIQTYQRSVALGTLPNARVESFKVDSARDGGMGQAMQGLGGALEKAAAVTDKIQEDKVASDVLAAQNEYQKRLSDALYAGDDALLATNGENAAKVDEQYKKIESQIRQEVTAKLPQFELAHTAFARAADKENLAGAELVNRHKAAETEKAFLLNVENGAATTAETTSRNYNNPVAVQQGLDRLNELGNVLATKQGAAAADAFKRKGASNLLDATMGAAYAKDDFDSMQTLMDKYRDKMGADSANKWTAAISARQKKIDQASLLSSLKDNPDFKDANGFFDVDKAMEYARNQKKIVSIGGGGNYSFDQVKELVAGNESGGNYNAHNGDSGAQGKYQFMPGTWRGVMGDAPMTPDNQEKAFEQKYKPIYDKYGAAGVLVAVYAGDDNAGRYMRGENLVGEGGEYSADAPQYSNGKEYPSVRQYVINALGSDGRGEQKEEPKYSEDELAGLEKQFQALHAEGIRKDTEQQHFAIRNVQDWLATNKDTPIDQKIAYIQAAGLRPAQAETLATGLVKEAQAEQKAQLEATSKTAAGALEVLDARGGLTVSAVDALRNQMTTDTYIKYMARATRAEKTDGEKMNNAVDKDWHALVKDDPTFGSAQQRNALIGSISEILDVEHTEGSDRRVKAAKFIDEARDKSKREYIAGYSTRNNAAFQQMEELYPGASSLVLKGDKNVDGYEWIGILKGMAAQTYTDPAAAKAWNTIFNNHLPLTENSFNELRDFYAREGAQ